MQDRTPGPNGKSAPDSTKTNTISTTFSSVFFGAGLAYLGVVLFTKASCFSQFLLAVLAFIKLVDSWWWYHFVLEESNPDRGLPGWYADFGFALALFALVGFIGDLAAWCCAFACCNLIGCARIDYATRSKPAGTFLRRAGGWLAVTGMIGAVCFSFVAIGARLAPICRCWIWFAGAGGTAHLAVTITGWLLWRRYRGGARDTVTLPQETPRQRT